MQFANPGNIEGGRRAVAAPYDPATAPV